MDNNDLLRDLGSIVFELGQVCGQIRAADRAVMELANRIQSLMTEIQQDNGGQELYGPELPVVRQPPWYP